eukprot:1722255-Rhodomonas_salina.2
MGAQDLDVADVVAVLADVGVGLVGVLHAPQEAARRRVPVPRGLAKEHAAFSHGNPNLLHVEPQAVEVEVVDEQRA